MIYLFIFLIDRDVIKIYKMFLFLFVQSLILVYYYVCENGIFELKVIVDEYNIYRKSLVVFLILRGENEFGFIVEM